MKYGEYKLEYQKNIFSRIFILPYPLHATGDQWGQWRRDIKRKYPIRFLTNIIIPKFFRKKKYKIIHLYEKLFLNKKFDQNQVIKNIFDPFVYYVENTFSDSLRNTYYEFNLSKVPITNKRDKIQYLDILIENKIDSMLIDLDMINLYTEIRDLYNWYIYEYPNKENDFKLTELRNKYIKYADLYEVDFLEIFELPADDKFKIIYDEYCNYSKRYYDDCSKKEIEMMNRLINLLGKMEFFY